MYEMEIQQLRHLAKEAEKHKSIAQAAVMFVTYHKAYKGLALKDSNSFLLEAARTNVNTYLTELVKVVEAEHGA